MVDNLSQQEANTSPTQETMAFPVQREQVVEAVMNKDGVVDAGKVAQVLQRSVEAGEKGFNWASLIGSEVQWSFIDGLRPIDVSQEKWRAMVGATSILFQALLSK